MTPMFGHISTKGRDEAKLYEPHLFGNILVISFQTQAELLRGALAANWGAQRRQHLDSRLNKYVVEPSSYALSLRWAQAMDSARRNGQSDRRSRCVGCRDRSAS